MNFYFLFFEFGALFALALIFLREYKNAETRLNLVLAFFYGIFLEMLNAHLSGSYAYSDIFLLRIYDVPIAIGIGWAIIYYLALKTAEIYRLKWWQTPLLMALVALSIDLALDIIAIRLGFWQWRIPLSQEWFGVPYDNLFGWMAVIWTFAFFINPHTYATIALFISRFFRNTVVYLRLSAKTTNVGAGVNLAKENIFSANFSRTIKYLAVIVSPFLLGFQINAYVALSALLSGRFSLAEIFGFYERQDFSYAYYPEVQTAKAYIFWVIISVLVFYLAKTILEKRENISGRFDKFSFSILTGMHVLFLIAIFTAGLYKQTPVFIIIAAAMLTFHLVVSYWPAYRK